MYASLSNQSTSPSSHAVLNPKAFFLMALAGVVVFTIIRTPAAQPWSSSVFQGNSKSHSAAYNRTLGFEALFMLILPHRQDQKDAAALLAHHTDIDLAIVDGVLPTSIPEYTLPSGNYRPNNEFSHGGQLGCWRSHMNTLRRIVQERISSALIFESDVDWDVNFKDQLALLSAHLPNATKAQPYGADWDVLWMGHCMEELHRDNPPPIVSVFADPTVPEKTKMPGFANDMLEFYGVHDERMRMVTPSQGPTCTGAYAVTLHGASKLLYELSYNELRAAIDNDMARLTRSGKLPGLTVTPPLVGQYRTGGRSDSDIDGGDGQMKRPGGEGVAPACVGRSMRREMERFVYGARMEEAGTEEWKAKRL